MRRKARKGRNNGKEENFFLRAAEVDSLDETTASRVIARVGLDVPG